MKKKILHELRRLANQLPQQRTQLVGATYKATPKLVRDRDGRPHDRIRNYTELTSIGVNHYRRLKRAYKRGGLPAVQQYGTNVRRLAEQPQAVKSAKLVATVATEVAGLEKDVDALTSSKKKFSRLYNS